MSAHAAIAPADDIRGRRTSPGRMVIVAGAYLAILIAVAIYPLASPLRDIWRPVWPLETAADAVVWLLWLGFLLRTLDRRHRGPGSSVDRASSSSHARPGRIQRS
jgi:hypothetical protein